MPLKRPRGWKEERGPKGEKLWVRKVGNYQMTFQPKAKFRLDKDGCQWGMQTHTSTVIDVLDDLTDLVFDHYGGKN